MYIPIWVIILICIIIFMEFKRLDKRIEGNNELEMVRTLFLIVPSV